jgi:hypothetical protein
MGCCVVPGFGSTTSIRVPMGDGNPPTTSGRPVCVIPHWWRLCQHRQARDPPCRWVRLADRDGLIRSPLVCSAYAAHDDDRRTRRCAMAWGKRLPKEFRNCWQCGVALELGYQPCGACGGVGSTTGSILGFKHRCATCDGNGSVLCYHCPNHPASCWACHGSRVRTEHGMAGPCSVCRPDEWKKWNNRFTAPPGYQYGSPPFG